MSACLLHALTLQEAIDATLAHHHRIKIFYQKLQSARAHKELVQSADYPKLTFQASHAFDQTLLSPRQETLHASSDEVSLELRQKLFDFGQTSKQLQAAEIESKIARLSLQETKALVALEVKRLYKLLVLEQKAIAVRRKDLQTKRSYLAQAKALLRQGLKTPADVSRMRAATIAAHDAVQRERAAYAKAKKTLELFMGEHLPAKLALQEDIFTHPVKLPQDFSHNFTLQKTKLAIQKQKSLYQATKRQKFGHLELQASLARIYRLATYNSNDVFLSYSLPLFDKQLRAQIQKSKIATLQTIAEHQDAKLTIQNRIASLRIDIDRLLATIAAKKAQIEAAKETLAIMQARYKEGLSNYIELLDSDDLLLRSRLALLQTLYTRSLLIDELRYLEGKL